MERIGEFSISGNELWLYHGDADFVEIPSNIEKICRFAFSGKKNLRNVVIPEGVTQIWKGAFNNCRNLESIIIPNSISCIDKDAFSGCVNLCRVDIEECVLEEIGTKELRNTGLLHSLSFQYLAEKAIVGTMLEEQIIASIKLKNNFIELLTRSIDEDEVVVLSNLFKIKKKLKIEEINTYIEMANKKNKAGVLAVLLDYKNKIFSSKDEINLQNNRIEKELGIKQRSVSEWREIFKFSSTDEGIRITGYKQEEEFVEVPIEIGGKTVVEIGEKVFAEKKKIRGIRVPNTIMKFGADAFAGCSGLADEKGFIIINHRLFGYEGKETEVKIPNGVKYIEINAFRACKSMKKVIIPDGVETIGADAFRGCSNLQSILIPSSVNKIQDMAFYYCSKLEEIVLPDGIREISAYQFANCAKIKTIVIPQTVQKIWHYAFQGCKSLKDIYATEVISSIEYGVFEKCLPDITLHAPKGSYVEKYASENGIPFVED